MSFTIYVLLLFWYVIFVIVILCKFYIYIRWKLFSEINYYLLKTLSNLTVFSCFHGVEKGCIGKEWVKGKIKDVFNLVFTPHSFPKFGRICGLWGCTIRQCLVNHINFERIILSTFQIFIFPWFFCVSCFGNSGDQAFLFSALEAYIWAFKRLKRFLREIFVKRLNSFYQNFSFLLNSCVSCNIYHFRNCVISVICLVKVFCKMIFHKYSGRSDKILKTCEKKPLQIFMTSSGNQLSCFWKVKGIFV